MAPIRTDSMWDPRKILDLYPRTYNFMCVGAARSWSNARCRWKIPQEYCIGAENILDAMGELDPRSEEIPEYLKQLARLLLCTQQHQNQAEEKLYEWSSKIKEVVVQLKHEKKMQSQIQKLKEELRESKQITTNERSSNVNQEIEVIRLKQELGEVTGRLDREKSAFQNLETQCAALTLQTANLRAKLTESQGSCHNKIADLIEANRRQTALTEQNRIAQEELQRTQAKLLESNQAAALKSRFESENFRLRYQIAATLTAHQKELDKQIESKGELASMVCTRDKKIAELERVLKEINNQLEGHDETSTIDLEYEEDKGLEAEWNPLSEIEWPGCVEDSQPVLGITRLKNQILELKTNKAALSKRAQKLVTELDGAELQISSCHQHAALLRTHGIALAICIILVASLLS